MLFRRDISRPDVSRVLMVLAASLTACHAPSSGNADGGYVADIDGADAKLSNPGVLPRLAIGRSALPFLAQAVSWDGRIVFGSLLDNAHRTQKGRGKCQVMVIRPERISRKAGRPHFGDAVVSVPYLCPQTDSRGERLRGASRLPGVQDLETGAITPDSTFDENPYRSDADGNAVENGAYSTYRIAFFKTADSALGGETGFYRAMVVVRDPYTESAAVETMRWTSGFHPLWLDGPVPLTMVGTMEPSVTLDGRLLFVQGQRRGELLYSFRSDQSAALDKGWSTPESITKLHHRHGQTLVNGVPFVKLYPIAAEPLRKATGERYRDDELIVGAYPWITLDGTELFFQGGYTNPHANPGGPEHTGGGRRVGCSVIGRWTGYANRLIDGSVNPTRLGHPATSDQPQFPGAHPTARMFVISPGAFGSIWHPYSDQAQLAIPQMRREHVFPLFMNHVGTSSLSTYESGYHEVSFHDTLDRHYLLYFHMNELLRRGNHDPTRTPDTSGNFRTGRLNAGAFFPVEYHGKDINPGVIGRAIYFAKHGLVTASLHEPRTSASHDVLSSKLSNKLTVELFVQPLGRFGRRTLIYLDGLFRMDLVGGNVVEATIWTSGGSTRLVSAKSLPSRSWSHIALLLDAESGKAALVVDGQFDGVSRALPAGRLEAPRKPLMIGPGSTRTASSENDRRAVMLIDEVAISNVVRDRAELTVNALIETAKRQSARPSGLKLPLGLNSARIFVPASNPLTEAKAKLGETLFFDKGLSVDRTVSCGSCHRPQLAFTDGQKQAIGIKGLLGPRNTPTILNRIFSVEQMWESRDADLEAQVLGPIFNPIEMGRDPKKRGEVAKYVRDKYGEALQEVFALTPGQRPSDEAVLQMVAKSIASYERLQLSGNSAFDRYQAGDSSALSAEQKLGRKLFFGKARCFGCHSGSNFTDEKLHNTGFVQGADLGRAQVVPRLSNTYRFKTPSLRDVSKTAPYLHDGSVASLREVVELYNRGGRFSQYRDSEIRPLQLTRREIDGLVAFLKALDGGR
jgi:cytochrome c peroxidase